ncbi:hypothetical protein M407DRAFT_230144 [Tulasnella calospora MUT 4182]|uniref:Uncharacterized protein n=1 Tax=Tulasnella calospora MUT 4182 TaxID=1051891 RepID=A0A0C3L401_9AGAM|nr:hypothetical protein M407DRAFT_230144 [Tulasnella calospora MUT 4182]
MRNRPPGLGFACEFAEPSPRAGNEGYRGDRVHAEGQATSIYSAPECGRQSSFWFPVMGEGDERDGRGLGCSRQDPRQLPCRLLRLVIAKPFGKTARATYKVVETSKVCIRSPTLFHKCKSYVLRLRAKGGDENPAATDDSPGLAGSPDPGRSFSASMSAVLLVDVRGEFCKPIKQPPGYTEPSVDGWAEVGCERRIGRGAASRGLFVDHRTEVETPPHAQYLHKRGAWLHKALAQKVSKRGSSSSANLWRNIVEGTPSLWCRISGREGLCAIRKALTMAKDAPLEITYWEKGSKTNPTAFFAQIDDRIAQVRSLDYFGHLQAILETPSATKLETLYLMVFCGQGWETDDFTLFGGKPASPALKNVRVQYIPVALGSLRPSGLRSLGLNNIPITSVEELLRILMESPALEDCSLNSLFLPGFTPEEHLQGVLRGMLTIEFEGVWVKPRQVEETLDWVFGHLGERLKDLPTSLVTGELDMHANLVLWLGTNLRVTNLELQTGVRFSQPRRMIPPLSRLVASMSNQWALPDPELVDANVLDEAGKWEILEMVEARHSFIRAQEDQGRRDVSLKHFKEIKLYGGGNCFSKEQAPNAEFLSAIEKVGRGAEIWWEGVKWVGSRA